VLFKHIADFHLCVVKTFSKKYGIPEDEIIQTIQESPEFKNMEIDPALHTVHTDPVHTDPVHTDPVHTDPVHTDPVHTDPVHTDAIESLGYKIDAITPPDTIPKKRIVKKKPTAAADTDVTITEPPPIPEQIQQDTETRHVTKKRVVKKKQVPAIETVAVTSEPVAVTSESVARERESDQSPVSSSEKKKVIKKTTAKNQAQAPIDAAPLVDCVKPKIIKRLKTT
jgi:hypothetical protein